MEGFLTTFPPFGLCGPPGPGPGPAPVLAPALGSWRKREGRFVTPQGLNYLELCRALLAHVSPAPAPAPAQVSPAPPRKLGTRECGVQVNARVDQMVQCSLGPKTLFGGEGGGDDPEGDRPGAPPAPQSPAPCLRAVAQPQTPLCHLRFLRPVSIYSPVFERRVAARKAGEDGRVEGGSGPPQPEEEEEEEEHTDREGGLRQTAQGANFQFLEQRYGFFHCKKCNIRWESAYVWCISGTSKVYYRQLCRKCQVGFNPYRVEAIICKGCSQTCCSCQKKQRHMNMKRPHRQDLCCRCRGMRLSCHATYSFKYIV